MLSIVSIYIGGILTLFMAIFHIGFPKIFKWGKDFERISEINKRVFFTIHLALYPCFMLVN